jgi:hypothetical protein
MRTPEFRFEFRVLAVLGARGLPAESGLPSAPTAVKAWIAAAPEWIEIRTVADPDEPALMGLDFGEREAIVSAEEWTRTR